MIVWEEKWRVRGMPEVGDYIQAFLCLEDDSICRTDEGLVVEVTDDGVVRFAGDPAAGCPSLTMWVCWRWRRGAVPETEKEFRREEIEA